jgi:hypothetical protein
MDNFIKLLRQFMEIILMSAMIALIIYIFITGQMDLVWEFIERAFQIIKQ